MKKLIQLIIAFLFLISTSYSQTDWEKHAGNPVLEPGPEGSWDDHSVESQSVLFNDSIYHMWYAGFDGVYYRIGHATSIDGIEWTKDPENPVLDVGPLGSWEESTVYLPCVLLHESVFHMWYDGAWGWIEQTGHATSTDGTNWTKDPLNPVLKLGQEGSWDDYQVFPMAGSVIYEDNLFKMWYGGGSTSFLWKAGYATSVDGSVWIKDTINNPIILPGNAGQWDDYSVLPGPVIRVGDIYHIWYNGCNEENRWRMGYASSTDGISWTKYSMNPVLDFGPEGSWDHIQAWNGYVMHDPIDQIFKMWYTGGDFGDGNIGYATSTMVGIEDGLPGSVSQQNNTLKCFPNPSSGNLNIQYTIFKLQNTKLELYSADGIKIKSLLSGKHQPGKYEMNIDLNNLPDGIYFIRLQAREQVETAKLILIK